MRKGVVGVIPSPKGHWVGDGFPVRSLFSYDGWGQRLSPFLLLDYAGPTEFTPSTRPRGVGEHPHRGFETVSIVYAGEVAHRDSAGNGGVIGPGDVQWMTAASGILHEEFHSPSYSRTGGPFEMAQLWVNLPAREKMSAPRYQPLLRDQIPDVELPAASGRLRIIAGEHAGVRGPAATFTDMNVWDLKLHAGCACRLDVPAGHMAAVAVLRGTVSVNGSRPSGPAELVVLDGAGDELLIEAAAAPGAETLMLVLSGEPIAEPIVGYGPFVMNSREEIQAAVKDFNAGKFGTMPASVSAG
jgi:redox-sensitive bicupin YhaK (pirin superfamily)